jgi:hypothetical protein
MMSLVPNDTPEAQLGVLALELGIGEIDINPNYNIYRSRDGIIRHLSHAICTLFFETGKDEEFSVGVRKIFTLNKPTEFPTPRFCLDDYRKEPKSWMAARR